MEEEQPMKKLLTFMDVNPKNGENYYAIKQILMEPQNHL